MSGPSPKGPLTPADYEAAAAQLGCEPAAVQAVAEVESAGYGFLPTGEPVILYERHVFERLTGGRFHGARASALPETFNLLSWPTRTPPGGYGPRSVQHAKLAAAVELDRTAALASCSWGLFQIMGENAGDCGMELQDFVNAAYRSTADQLRTFTAFVSRQADLLAALRGKRWAAFARIYNGPKFGDYELRMAAAYAAVARDHSIREAMA